MRSSLVVLALVAGASAARAQGAPPNPEASSAAYQRALALAKQWRHDGDRATLAEAAALFKQAFLAGEPAVAECDFALALHYLGEDARAYARFSRCLPRLAADDPVRRAGYQKVADEVARALLVGHVPIDIAATPPDAEISISSFPADETTIAPTVVWLRPGRHTLRAHVDGHVDEVWQVTVTDAEAVQPARRAWRPALSPTVASAGDPIVPPPSAIDAVTQRERPSRRAAHLTLGLAGALVVSGAVVHVLGREVRADLARSSGDAYADRLTTWHWYQRSTIGLYAAGAIAAGVGAWLQLRGRAPVTVTVPARGGDERAVMVWWNGS